MLNKDFLKKMIKNRNVVYIYFFVLVVFLEVTLFNFRFYQSFSYDVTYLNDADINSSIEAKGNSVFYFKDNDAKIFFKDINKEVKNVYIDMVFNEESSKSQKKKDFYEIKKSKANKLVKAKLIIDDKSNKKGIYMPERSVVSDVERTKYIPVYLKGETKNMTIEFKNLENKEFRINSIAINKPIPFNFSFIRVFALFFIISILYIIRPKSKFYEYELNFKRPKQCILLFILVIIQSIIMMSASFINPTYVYNTVYHQKQYNRLAEAIIDGHFYLDEVPDSKLAELDNPYDKEERYEKDVHASWDHAYFEGKYYVYFGIVPALIFNVPAKLFGDMELIPFNCILAIIPFFILFSYLLMYSVTRRFIEKGFKIPFLLYIIMTTLFINCIGTACVVIWPDLYTLPIFMALTFAIMGLHLWIEAVDEESKNGKLSKKKLFLGSLFMALIAGCRPQLLLSLFLAIPIFWKVVFKERRLFSKSSVLESVSFALPIVVFALFMFYYNYARFGSIFDFGANYNLTTNDMTSRGVNIFRIPQGLFYYFIQPLNIKGIFPYVSSTKFETYFMGTNIREATYGGAFFFTPIIFIVFLIFKAKDEIKKVNLWAFSLLLIIFSVVIACADSIMAGILSRYFLDFCWLLMLASIIIIYALYNKYLKGELLKVLKSFIFIGFIISMYVAFAIAVGGEYFNPADTNPSVFWKIASLIQFWA